MNWKEAYQYLITEPDEARIVRRSTWHEETFVGVQLERGAYVLAIAKLFDTFEGYNTWKWYPSYDDLQATDWEPDIFVP
jgi:hypothetical protein